MTAASHISAFTRDATLDRLERETFDVAVIGGGITGAGVAREATQRGLRAALLEAEDFGAGTSSRSSKLIHGGLRYLAMGDVALVRSSALERKEIFRLAPHLAERRWMVVPARSYAGLMKLRAGITTYEKLGAVEGEDLHRNWNREEMAEEEPYLDRERYKYCCAYREYLTDDARLVLANLRDAVRLGAVAANHARVDRLVTEDGVVSSLEAVCTQTGRRVHVRARAFINAAGPWVEPVRRLEDPDAPKLLHLSKGVHFCMRSERVPVRHMLALGTDDRRTIFVIRRGPIVYVGTTDTTYPGGSDLWPEITPEDIDYLLRPINRDLTIDPVSADDVTAAWAGLRPLIAEPGKDPTEISRRDEVMVGPSRLVTIAGGKLTGYRPMAREVLEKTAEVCGLELAPPPAPEPPLPGGDFSGELEGLAARVATQADLPIETAHRLARLYGDEAGEVASLGTTPLVESGRVLSGEVTWAMEAEGASTLEDVLYRRLRTSLFSPVSRDAAVEPVAGAMAARLGWTDERRQAEMEGVRRLQAADLAFAPHAR